MKGWLIGLGMLLTVPLLAQTSLSGKVVDAAEEPLVGGIGISIGDGRLSVEDTA